MTEVNISLHFGKIIKNKLNLQKPGIILKLEYHKLLFHFLYKKIYTYIYILIPDKYQNQDMGL